ncbi:MAG: radical SAM/SPASM domain-containing protein [Armatimonadota bacterium]
MVDIKHRLIDGVVRLTEDEQRFLSRLRTVARIGKFVAPAPGHRHQLRLLEWAIDHDHAAIQLVRRIVHNCNRNYLRSIAGLFVEHGWEGYRQRRRMEALHKVGIPSFIVISPLARCNLNCVGCYAGAYGDREPFLSYQDMTRLIDETRTWGSRFVTISGGEPTIFWDKIPGDTRGLRDLFAQYSDMTFLMYTNGTLIDDEMAADMAELGNVAPGISVEGFRAETDGRRGEGVFDRIVAAMDVLRSRGVLFGASVTYTSQNWETVASEQFIDFLLDSGCIFAWYFMYVPVGRAPDLSLMVTPEQRRAMCQTTWRWLTTRPIFVADFWNSGVLTKGCIAAGRSAGYLHVTHRGDICPCVFMLYSAHNLHDTDSPTPLLDAVKSDFFAQIREGQRERQHNPLAPCQIVDHPEVLKCAVESTGARDTQEGQRILGDLHEEVARRAAQWNEIADELWTRSGVYTGFRETYRDGGWLPPG